MKPKRLLLQSSHGFSAVDTGGVDTYTATVNAEKKTVEYIGKADDNLWPAAGTYCIRAVLTWSADGETTRRFATEDKFLVIT